jgi:hypothetical protein
MKAVRDRTAIVSAGARVCLNRSDADWATCQQLLRPVRRTQSGPPYVRPADNRCPGPANVYAPNRVVGLGIYRSYCILRHRILTELVLGGYDTHQTTATTDVSSHGLAGLHSEEPALQTFPLTI